MYTVEQIRKAGTEGEINHHDVEHIISTLELLYGSNNSQNSGKPIVMRPLPPEKVDELIKSIPVNQLNLEQIAKSGRISGSLLVDLRLIINKAIQAAMSA